MEFDDHLTCSWSAVELINRRGPTSAVGRFSNALKFIVEESLRLCNNAMAHIFDKLVSKYSTGAVTDLLDM
uniref:Uncharacterized protein n=1 Tax=Helianthus annuus TaxID=4232 RepID=A0A251RNN5_HELAN